MSASIPTSPKGATSQGLLASHRALYLPEFKARYQRHASIAMPWALANGVSYYAQVHGPLRWTSPEIESKYKALGIDLEVYDAASEMAFPPSYTAEAEVGKPYRSQVIVPDEKEFLFSAASEHIKFVEAGAVEGERIEFIRDGKALVEFDEWQLEWERTKFNCDGEW